MDHGREVLSAVNGRVEDAVRDLLLVVRAQWRVFTAVAADSAGKPALEVLGAQLDRELLKRHSHSPALAPALLRALTEYAGGADRLRVNLAQSHAFLQAVLGPVYPAADLRYFAVRDLRRRFDLTLSYESARLVRLLTEAATAHLAGAPDRRCHASHPEKGLLPCLRKALEASPFASQAAWERLPEFFLEALGILDLARATGVPDIIEFLQTELSADTLLSHFFGVPTAIPGFDALFGGGGLMLADTWTNRVSPGLSHALEANDESIGGRTVLAVGPFGSGKSLLTMQFAVEVARKGGIAWVMALEQGVDECLFSMESLGISVHNEHFLVLTDLPGTVEALNERTAGMGALVFLKAPERTYRDFLLDVEEKLTWMHGYSLRLLIVDPINALVRPDNPDLRARTMEFVHKAKRLHVNLWLTCERQEDGPAAGHFEENIADTVLHLGLETRHLHQQRFIEVTKSRLQRERSGAHVFIIRGGNGIRVYPNTADVSVEGSRREYPLLEETIDLGVARFEEVLGGGMVAPGDIVAYHGPTGTSKTLCGIHFLLRAGGPHSTGGRSLFVADFDLEWMEKQIAMAVRSVDGGKSAAQVDYCPIAPGYIAPGEILESISAQLNRAHREGRAYSRILVTNLGRWIMGMPFLGDDPVFAIALVHLLRRHATTAVMVLGHYEDEKAGAFSKLILDHADCVVRFRRVPIRGRTSEVVDVQKTRTMAHRRDVWELRSEAPGPRLIPSLALLRISASGKVQPVRITLHLHSDTPAHVQYNQTILNQVQATLSHAARLAEQERSYDPNILPQASSSAIDELQVLQLDEFQLPRGESLAASKLCEFSTERFGDMIGGRLPDLVRQVKPAGARGFVAVPFYSNIGLLAYRRSAFGGKRFPTNWGKLAEVCAAWEKKHRPQDLFFACHVSPSNNCESYNCLFFEILYSLSGFQVERQEDNSGASACELAALLAKPEARAAARIFWTLCHRSHAAVTRAWKPDREIDMKVFARAQVWRHWFSTLIQMLESEVSPRLVSVSPLYGHGKEESITTAGEWYLGVPAHSVAQETGFEIIRFLCTREREIQRMHLGVGLPTRSDYYQITKKASPHASVSKYFFLHPEDVGKLLEKPLRRSAFSCYQLFNGSIATHLQNLLDVPNVIEIEDQIQSLIENLQASIQYIRAQEGWQRCVTCQAGQAR